MLIKVADSLIKGGFHVVDTKFTTGTLLHGASFDEYDLWERGHPWRHHHGATHLK